MRAHSIVRATRPPTLGTSVSHSSTSTPGMFAQLPSTSTFCMQGPLPCSVTCVAIMMTGSRVASGKPCARRLRNGGAVNGEESGLSGYHSTKPCRVSG